MLSDILKIGKQTDNPAHFIGSIVYIHDNVYVSSKIKQLIIIDGQQRLTTLTLIYLALYHLAKKRDEIRETYLINKYADGSLDKDKFKLKTAGKNIEALAYLYKGEFNQPYPEYSNLIENFNYFKKAITTENYQTILTGLNKLIFVEISLERGKDDPQRIFESLNSTGLALTQADLIRNHILIELTRTEQQRIYQDYWSEIESLARDTQKNISLVSDFIRDYLILKTKDIPKKNNVYNTFKKFHAQLNTSDIEQVLIPMKQLAGHYHKFINPQYEEDEEIREQLADIRKLEVNVAYPFLLQVYDDYINKQIINKKQLVEILALIQSFIWRRFIVGLPTNALNNIFITLCDKLNPEEYILSIQFALLEKTGNQRFPDDEETIAALRIKNIYGMQTKNCRYLLEKLENYQNNEKVNFDKLTIEHIFPQTPDSEWESLDEKDFILLKEHQHTLANLTLSGNNGKLSNQSFLKKRDLERAGYSESRLWLNKYLASIDVWNADTLNQRFNQLKDRFLQIWFYPKVDLATQQGKLVNIFVATSPLGRKLTYAEFKGQKIAITQVARLYHEILKRLFATNREVFFNSELKDKLKLTQSSDHLIAAIELDDGYFVESNFNNENKFSRIKLALELCDGEEDLFIKYSE